MEKNSQWFYWDGAVWSVSNLTLAQSNTVAEIVTNIATFTTIGITFKWGAIFHSFDGSTTPELTLVTVEFDFYGICDVVNKCIVYGCAKDIDGTINIEEIKVKLYKDAVQYAVNTIIRYPEKSIIPRVGTGYFEIELIENENMKPVGAYYIIIFISKNDNNIAQERKYKAIIPNEDSKSIWDVIIEGT